MDRHNSTRTAIVIVIALALWTTSSAAQGNAAGTVSLTVLTGPAEYGDYYMQVDVEGVTLTSPGTLASAQANTGYLYYSVNGAPAPKSPFGTKAYTDETSFFFTGLDHGDVVAVELLKSDGSSYDPPLRIEQPAISPGITIETDAPDEAGNYTMDVDVVGYDLVSPNLNGSVPGEGHLAYYVNGEPAPPAKNGTLWLNAFQTYMFVNLSVGDVVTAELVDHDNATLTPRILVSQRIGAGPSFTVPDPTVAPGEYTLRIDRQDHDGPVGYGLNGEVVAVKNGTSHTYDGLEPGDVLSVELLNATGEPLSPPFVSTVTVQPLGASSSTGSTVTFTPPVDPGPGQDDDTNNGNGDGTGDPPGDVNTSSASTRGIVIALGVIGVGALAAVAAYLGVRRGP